MLQFKAAPFSCAWGEDGIATLMAVEHTPQRVTAHVDCNEDASG